MLQGLSAHPKQTLRISSWTPFLERWKAQVRLQLLVVAVHHSLKEELPLAVCVTRGNADECGWLGSVLARTRS